MRYICSICGYVYDEDVEKVPFSELPDDWACPMCKAPKSMFEAEGEQAAEAKEARPADVDSDMMPLSPGVLAALFSNLARGAEKQYKAKESEALGRIAEFFTSAVPSIPDADLELVRSLSEECTGSSYPAAKATASAEGDRGALRALSTDVYIFWGQIFAFSSLMTLPVLILFLLFQKQFIQSLTMTGIKG